MKSLALRHHYTARPRWPTILSIALFPWLLSGRAEALDAIGTAVAVEGEVSGSIAGRTSPLAKGDGVVSNEVLRTQPESSGQIGFIDQTKLFVGPSATITLDRFAFDQSGSASRFTVNVSKGALRFISGRSAHGAYGVKTPLGSLGLRGTIVDVVVERARVVVTDETGPNQGPVIVTARNGASLTLEPGQSAVLTRAGVGGPFAAQGAGLPDFAAACGGCGALLGAVAPHDPAGPGNSGGGSGGGNDRGGQSSSSQSPR